MKRKKGWNQLNCRCGFILPVTYSVHSADREAFIFTASCQRNSCCLHFDMLSLVRIEFYSLSVEHTVALRRSRRRFFVLLAFYPVIFGLYFIV